jgi:hypothetical protein
MTAFTDAAVITSRTIPDLGIEIVADVETSTIPTTTQVIYTEQLWGDSATLATVTKVIYVEQLWRDSATLATVTQVIAEDLFVHPTGFWGPFDTDNGAL